MYAGNLIRVTSAPYILLGGVYHECVGEFKEIYQY